VCSWRPPFCKINNERFPSATLSIRPKLGKESWFAGINSSVDEVSPVLTLTPKVKQRGELR
jgi:hypothetical protein